MRLIHIPTMLLREYQGEEVPPYAILSHTWGAGEVNFVDFDDKEGRASMQGYPKIRDCCRQAESDGLDLVWIDTCCIDKRSSAELSEAINSMFKWYQDAAICYAYLEDVSSETDGIRLSRWFTRGWTLQELLAPSVVVFYSRDWARIGTRRDLAELISQTTQINIQSLETGNFADFSIAQRMSWASQRETTRIEDQAYCLLGLFDVNMPLLYGEGEQAFLRLQHEIMKQSDDQTLFAWFSSASPNLSGGLLASSPALFADSGHIVKSRNRPVYGPYAATNKGLQISLPLLRSESTSSMLVPSSRRGNNVTVPSVMLSTASSGNIAVLNCQPSDDNDLRVGLYIEQDSESGSYIRVNYQSGIALIPTRESMDKATHTDLLIQMQNKTERSPVASIYQTDRPVLIQPLGFPMSEFNLMQTNSDMEWQNNPTGSLSSVISSFTSATEPQKPCVLEYRNPSGHGFVLVLQKHVALNKVTGLKAYTLANATMAGDEEGLRAQVKDATYDVRRHAAVKNQISSKGYLSIAPKVIEARHASIVSLEADVVVSPFLKRRTPSSLAPIIEGKKERLVQDL
ncbi:heterokaryon incompatibility protein-domain-containing protein [Astrocystis sublimbata]|nr:heterokaryon incompatibility protein-domain-containing protein [Astrocystis sublimbata]